MSASEGTALQVQTAAVNLAFGNAQEFYQRPRLGYEMLKRGYVAPWMRALKEGSQPDQVNGSKEAGTGRRQLHSTERSRAHSLPARGLGAGEQEGGAPGPSWPSLCPLFSHPTPPYSLGPEPWEASGRALPAGVGAKEAKCS